MQATLEHTSIWALVEAASPLAQAVLLILLAASLVSWYVIVQRSLLLGGARRRLRASKRAGAPAATCSGCSGKPPNPARTPASSVSSMPVTRSSCTCVTSRASIPLC